MNFTVDWAPRALVLLADLWLNAANPMAVTAAAHAIDATLAAAPHTAGPHVFDTVYEYTHAPRSVEYEVDDAARRVSVLNVWETAAGRPGPSGN